MSAFLSSTTEPGSLYFKCPAFDVIAPRRNKNGEAIVTADMNVRVFVRGMWHEFSFGSVVSYATEHHEDPIAAIDRARELGHPLVWVNACATVIHDGLLIREVYAGLEFGEVVRFEGISYTLAPAPNDNVSIVRIPA